MKRKIRIEEPRANLRTKGLSKPAPEVLDRELLESFVISNVSFPPRAT